jgi:hypothetical protein
MRTTAMLRRGVFAAGLAGALGFGAVQALASPTARTCDRAGRCDPEACERKCQTQFGVSGFCTGRGCWCITG